MPFRPRVHSRVRRLDRCAPRAAGAALLIAAATGASAVPAQAAALAQGLRPVPQTPVGKAAASAQRPEMSNERFLVKYRDPAQAADKAARAGRKLGLEVSAQRRLATGATLVRSAKRLDAATARSLRAALAEDPSVEYVEPDRVLQPTITPNDPEYSYQWGYFRPAYAPAGINAPPAWDLARGGGVTVAVVDTGITRHTDLNPNVVAGYDFISDTDVAQDGTLRDADASDPGDYVPADDPNCGNGALTPSSWHGTHVAGTIGAVWGNGTGGVGVAHYAKIQPVRVLGRCGGYLSDVADGIVWASGGAVPGVPANATPAKVINLSLGGYGSCSATEQSAIDTAVGRGATVVVAAGNDNTDARNSSPASCNSVVAVAALDRQGNRAFYSNYGPAVDVAAPGGETTERTADGILSTLNSGTTAPAQQTSRFYQGTSMATPHVSGVVALVQTKRRLTPAQVETALKNNARPVPGACSGGCGAGVVDAYRTVSSTQKFYPAP